MSSIRREMVTRACRRYGAIHACGCRRTLSECFTEEGSVLIFWFNSDDGSTHIEVEKCSEGLR